MRRFILSATVAIAAVAGVIQLASAKPGMGMVPSWARPYQHGHDNDTIVARYRNGNQLAYIVYDPLGENDWAAQYTMAFSQDTMGVHEFSGPGPDEPATHTQWHAGTQTRYTANCAVRLTLVSPGDRFMLSSPVCHAVTPALARMARASGAENYTDGSTPNGTDDDGHPAAIGNGTVSNPARLQKSMGTWTYDGYVKVYTDLPPDNRAYRFTR